MSKKTVMLNFKGSEGFRERLQKAAEVLDKPYSQIVREATSEKLDELATEHPELQREHFVSESAAA